MWNQLTSHKSQLKPFPLRDSLGVNRAFCRSRINVNVSKGYEVYQLKTGNRAGGDMVNIISLEAKQSFPHAIVSQIVRTNMVENSQDLNHHTCASSVSCTLFTVKLRGMRT